MAQEMISINGMQVSKGRVRSDELNLQKELRQNGTPERKYPSMEDRKVEELMQLSTPELASRICQYGTKID